MKTISIWASKNQYQAITLIVLIEFIKNIIGFSIGNDAFPILSKPFIELGVLAIVLLVSFLQIYYQHEAQSLTKEAHYQLRIRSTTFIFFCSFVLSVLLGNHFKGLGYSFHSQTETFAATSTATSVDSTTTTVSSSSNKLTTKKKHHLFSKKATTESSDTGKRIGYILLFLLSLVLTYGGAFISCSIACSGYGFWAVLTFLLTLGIFSAGVYFLIKAFSKNPTRLADMSKEQRKKERKKYFIIWGIVTLAVGLFTLIVNSVN